jgi:cohesin complex subunit SCC1
VDLPADQSHAVNPATLTLPDVLTELDLLAPLPDPALLLGTGLDLSRDSLGNGVLDWGTQSLITDSIEQKSAAESRVLLDDDLGLDLGDDDFTGVMDVERGRDRVSSAWLDDNAGDTTKLYDDDLGLDLDNDPLPDQHGADTTMGADINMTDLPGLDLDDEFGAELSAQTPRPRDAASPLSGLRRSPGHELDTTFVDAHGNSLYEPPEEESLHEAQRIKRRKVLEEDSNIEISAAQIHAQQNDRSKILKPFSFLPRDPMLLALMQMQKNGGFVSSILGDGRTHGWAPELRDVLSVEIIRRSGDLKRKRDSGVSDMYLSDGKEAPGIEIPDDEPSTLGAHNLGDASALSEGMFEQLPSDGIRRLSIDDDDRLPGSPGREMTPPDDFNDTTFPLLHPADAGPISQGTRHAVHLLRDHFGPESANSPSQRQKSSVMFQDLLPKETTSRSNATKMFFEVLVLATKDAVKVEQKADTLSGPIRLRAKRGLWGEWAEESAGGQIAEAQELLGGAEE